METDKQLSLLTKALEAGLLTAAQASELLQIYSADPTKSITSLMLTRGILSADRLHLLTQSFGPPQTDGATAQSSPAVAAPDIPATVVGREQPAGDTGTHASGSQTMGTAPMGGTVQWSPQQLSDQISYSVPKADGPVELSSEPRIQGLARYLLRKEVARGGLGRIVLAHDQHVGRDVAFKELLQQSARATDKIERFFEEAQVTGQLEHPGIVPIYELGLKPDGNPFYTMKFLRGQPYSAAIKAYHQLAVDDPSRPFRLNELLNVFVDICNAVAYAHSKGVLHRDLKPANVMLGDFGEALVVDWGLAKLIGAADRPPGPSALVGEITHSGTVTQSAQSVRTTFRKRTEQTMVGTIAGTIPYMSPEQAMGKVDELDARSDIFSLGAILYEVLVGRPPYGGIERSQLLPKVWECEFPPPRAVNPNVPKALEAVCLKALAKSPADRYPTGRELGHEVARWLAGEPVEAYPDPWWKRLERWVRRHPTLCGSTAAAIVVGIALVSFFAWRESERVANERRAFRDAFAQGQQEYFAGVREAARDTLRQAKTIADREPHLADEAADLDRFLAQVEAELAEAAARRAAAERFAGFQQARDQASFYRTYLTGLPQAENLAQTLAAADAALALYPGAADGNVDAVTRDPYLTEQERNLVLAGVRQMLIVKAGALSERVAGQAPAEQHSHAEAALGLLERAKALGITESAYHRQRAQALLQLGKKEAAQAELAAAEKSPPRSAEDFFLLGLDRYALRDYPAAIASFQDSLRLDPQQFWAQYYTAVCYLSNLGEWRPEGSGADERANAAAAVAHLTALLGQKPDFEWIYVLRGAALGATGDFGAAEQDFAKALALRPDLYAVFVNRAMVRIQQQKYKEAIADLVRAIELEPGSYQAYVNLAEAYRRLGDSAAALNQANQLVEKFPDVVAGYRIRAYLRQEKGELDPALADLDEAARRAPNDPALPDLHLQRARLLFLARRYADSLKAYQQAVALRPADANREVLRGLPLMELAQFGQALDVFNRFLQHAAPAGAEARAQVVAYRERGLAKAALKDPVGAVADFTLALALPWQPQTDYDRTRMTFVRTRRGWTYLTESARLALADFEALVSTDPNNAELYTGRGYARALLGDLAAAAADADKAVSLKQDDLEVHYNAACVLALAAGKAASPDAAADVRPQADSWRQRALALLRRILDNDRLPPAARQSVRQQLRLDPAFDLIRTHPDFRALFAEKEGK